VILLQLILIIFQYCRMLADATALRSCADCCVYPLLGLLAAILVLQPANSLSLPQVYENETTSILLPDNETIVQMNIAVKNHNPVMGHVSDIIQSPAVLDQLVATLAKTLEVHDKKEAMAIEQSVRTAFKKIGEDNKSDADIEKIVQNTEILGQNISLNTETLENITTSTHEKEKKSAKKEAFAELDINFDTGKNIGQIKETGEPVNPDKDKIENISGNLPV